MCHRWERNPFLQGQLWAAKVQSFWHLTALPGLLVTETISALEQIHCRYFHWKLSSIKTCKLDQKPVGMLRGMGERIGEQYEVQQSVPS